MKGGLRKAASDYISDGRFCQIGVPCVDDDDNRWGKSKVQPNPSLSDPVVVSVSSEDGSHKFLDIKKDISTFQLRVFIYLFLSTYVSLSPSRTAEPAA
jgi:hypothetical protein